MTPTTQPVKPHAQDKERTGDLDGFVSNFIDKLPSSCALVVIAERSREHTWLGYGDERNNLGPMLRSGAISVSSAQTLEDVAAGIDSKLRHLRLELKRRSSEYLVKINSTVGSSLTDQLTSRSIPWAIGSSTAVEVLLGQPDYRKAIAEDLLEHQEGARRKANLALKAVAGQSAIYQRDVWKDNTTQGRHFRRELLILEDRRILQVDTVVAIGRGCDLQQAVVVDDLGVPTGVSLEGDITRIRTSSTLEKEVVIATERGRQTVGYRNVPVTLNLEDPIGPSVLMALVELGCASIVT